MDKVNQALVVARTQVSKNQAALCATLAAVLCAAQLKKRITSSRRVAYLFGLARKKIQQRDEVFSRPLPAIGLPSETKELILSSSVIQLTSLLNQQKITSEQILVTYYERTRSIGRELELVCESRFEEALQEARACDKVRQSSKDPTTLPPLFGIPISCKEVFRLKGFDCSYGAIAIPV